MVLLTMKGGWKFVFVVFGELSVVLHPGIPLMLILYAMNLASEYQKVSLDKGKCSC